jgi:hypothetical protein
MKMDISLCRPGATGYVEELEYFGIGDADRHRDPTANALPLKEKGRRIDRSSVQSLQLRLHMPRLSCNLLFGHGTCSPGPLSAAPSRFLALAPPAGVFGVPALSSRAGGVIEEEATFSPFATVQTSWLQDAELQDEDTG